LAFDSDAASAYAELFAAGRRAGGPAATLDLIIGAIARCHDPGVVTRNAGGFEEYGLTLINPWGTA
jgi:predicted nucleic acid-binding protein